MHMLPNHLSDLRIWANYVEIDSFVALRESGFRACLDQYLHTITFFYAGIAEIGALAILGAERTLRIRTDVLYGLHHRE